jgi:hypothetical protein
MSTRYRHTQGGSTVLAVVGGAAVAGSMMLKRKLAGAMLPGMATLGLVGWLFRSLTIEVTDQELSAAFGSGWYSKTVALDDIETVAVVRNRWYYGWGLKVTPHGMLYSVAGLDAVEIRLRDGTTFRLGTDEPYALRAAIESARGARDPDG